MEQQDHHSSEETASPSVKREKGCGCGRSPKVRKAYTKPKVSKPVVRQRRFPRRKFVPFGHSSENDSH